ncbi:UDP-diphosphatase, partial [bacterium]
KDAARFSFNLAIPAIFGAVIFEIIEHTSDLKPAFLIGTAVSALVGFFSLKFTIGVLSAGKFWAFAPYCAIAAIIGLLFC